MEKLLLKWGIEIQEIKTVTEKSTERINGNLILKRKANLNEIKKNIAINEVLKKTGLPVMNILKTKDNKSYVTYDGHHYMLTERIEGRHMTEGEILKDEELIKETGKVIANLHKGLKSVEDDFDFYKNDLMKEFDGWILESINKMEDSYFSKSYYDELVKRLKYIYPQLIKQPIHRDVHLGNMLFKDHKLVGYIDFDISRHDARIFDIAYFAAYILSQNLNALSMETWLNFYQNLLEGYQSVIQLTDIEVESIWDMMIAIEVLCTAYFVKIGDSKLAKSADDTAKWLVNASEDMLKC